MLALVSALGPIAMQILLPAIPIIKDSFAVSTGVAQLTLSLSMAAIAVATLVYGPLSDRYGRKPVLMCGITLTIIGSIACVMAPSIALLIAGRILQAAGGAVGLVVARAIVRDVYDARESASVIATLVMVMVVMPATLPPWRSTSRMAPSMVPPVSTQWSTRRTRVPSAKAGWRISMSCVRPE